MGLSGGCVMVRMAWRMAVGRGLRSVVLFVAVVVAATGFTVLTASSRAQRLATVGQVQARARTSYDILVRPAGARSGVESRGRLVQPGFLGSGFGGISMGQLAAVLGSAVVAVAAPVAVVGYVIPHAGLNVDVTVAVRAGGGRAGVARVDGVWDLHDGSGSLAQAPEYVLATRSAVTGRGSDAEGGCGPDLDPSDLRTGLTVTTAPASVLCFFSRSDVDTGLPWYATAKGHVSASQVFPFPFLLVAVDPVAESRLVGLDKAASPGGVQALESVRGPDDVPVLMAAASPVQASLDLSVSSLPSVAVSRVEAKKPLTDLASLPARPVSHQQVSAAAAYQVLKKQITTPVNNIGYPGLVWQYWTVSQPSWQATTSTPRTELGAVPVVNDLAKLWVDLSDFSVAPAGTDDVQFRSISLHRQPQTADSGEREPPSLRRVGDFDASRLSGLDDVTRQVLTGYATAPTTGADAASRAVLGGGAVGGSLNIGALVSSAPSMITSLTALPQLVGGTWEPGAGAAPLSAIRVRVKGVTGVDPVSRERVRLVAQQIRARTGLDVDVTVGASSTTVRVDQPAGRFGRPALRLDQSWVRLGVAVAIVRAVDVKSVALFLLVLLVSGLSVANVANASVRARRVELGTLACTGWSRGAIFRLVLGEVGLIGAAAGAVSAVASVAIGSVAGTTVSWPRALVAVPVALAVALLAGLVPARVAATATPAQALLPAVSGRARTRPTDTLPALAWSAVTRVRSRSVLAGLALAVAAAAGTAVLIVALGFRGAVVGTALGDAVAVQTRAADYAAVAATTALAGLGVANLTFLTLRERGAELATMLATGWSLGALRRLLLLESALLTLPATAIGAGLGLLGGVLLFGTLPAGAYLGAGLAIAVTSLVALAATAAATTMLARLPLTDLLTENG